MGAEKVEVMGLERPVETATPAVETATPVPPAVGASHYPPADEVTAPACFDNAAHVLQEANAATDNDESNRRVAVAMQWRLLGEAAHRRDIQRYESGLR